MHQKSKFFRDIDAGCNVKSILSGVTIHNF